MSYLFSYIEIPRQPLKEKGIIRKNNVGGKINKVFESGHMSKTTQTFRWTETLRF